MKRLYADHQFRQEYDDKVKEIFGKSGPAPISYSIGLCTNTNMPVELNPQELKAYYKWDLRATTFLAGCDSNPRLLPIMQTHCKQVEPEDIAAFIEGGSVDESRLEPLIFACTLIDWKPSSTLPMGNPAEIGMPIPRSYALLKHLFHGDVRGREIKPEPSILSQLVAGRVGSACEIAQRRLRISDLHPVMTPFPTELDQTVGLRLAASLLIPVNSIESLSRLVLRKQEEDAT